VGRLPFDPQKTAAARAERVTIVAAPLTVSQVAAKIGAVITSGLPEPLRFVGEVSGFRDRTHWYFDLKDAGAVVNCVCFQSTARKVGFSPLNGQQVLVKGRVEYYAPGGKVSVLIESMESVGAGSLDIAFRALCDELRALGWFAQERKRSLPSFPRRVGVITSRTGAALQDVLVTMKRRCPAVEILIVDAKVQGALAAPEVAHAIRYLSERATTLGLDAILVTRGGGSMEDLGAFNNRDVASAIIESTVPVVAAIGHETDTTIAELVADERCATPTQAAMRLTPDREALMRQVHSTMQRLASLTLRGLRRDELRLQSILSRPLFSGRGTGFLRSAQGLNSLSQRLSACGAMLALRRRSRIDRLAARLQAGRPAAVYAHRLTSVSVFAQRLRAAMTLRLASAALQLEGHTRQLSAVGPMQVLDRGYSITFSTTGEVLRTALGAAPGSVIRSRLADGELESTVGRATEAPAIQSTRLARGKRKPRPQDGPTLF